MIYVLYALQDYKQSKNYEGPQFKVVGVYQDLKRARRNMTGFSAEEFEKLSAVPAYGYTKSKIDSTFSVPLVNRFYVQKPYKNSIRNYLVEEIGVVKMPVN